MVLSLIGIKSLYLQVMIVLRSCYRRWSDVVQILSVVRGFTIAALITGKVLLLRHLMMTLKQSLIY